MTCLILARRAGIVVDWRDYANRPHRVSLTRSDACLPPWGCRQTADDLSHSRRSLDEHVVPPLTGHGRATRAPSVEGDSRPAQHTMTAMLPISSARNAARHRVIPYLKMRLSPARGRAKTPDARGSAHQMRDGFRYRTERANMGLAAQIYGLHSPDDAASATWPARSRSPKPPHS
jgi:hypothetical protein